MNTSPTEQKNSTIQQIMDMTLDVQGVDQNGEAVIVVKFDRIQSKVSYPVPIEFDTAKDGPADGKAATFAPLFKAMTQDEFEVTMTARGEIKDVKVPQEVTDVLKTNQAAMGDLATPKGLQEAIMHWAFVLPEKGPEQGERSIGSAAVKTPLGISVETSYTYDGVKEVDGKKFARFLPSVTMNVQGSSTMQTKVKDQKSDGEVLFDIEQGRLASMDRKYQAALEITEVGRAMQEQVSQNIQVKLAPK